MKRQVPCAFVACAAAFAAFAPSGSAASLALDKTGGALPGVTTFFLAGSANRPYLLLFSPVEQAFPVAPGVALAIPPSFAHLSVALPGFLGTLDATGKAQVPVPVPADPILQDVTVSFQAVLGPVIDTVSNLVRLTFATPGTFEPTLGAPPLPVAGGTLAKQPDGTVLLLGGSGPAAQSYDPRVEEFQLAGTTFGVGLLAQTVALADGRVFFCGGLGLDGAPTDAAAVYDPQTGQTQTLVMLSKRAGHGAARMQNGKVLITGGLAVFDFTDLLAFLSGILGTTEVFDPATGTFSAGPNMLEPRALHTATALPNGEVLVAGGLTLIPIVNIPTVSNTAYAFNPTLNTFGLPKFFTGARMLHSATALSDGRALLVGGLSVDFSAVLTSGSLDQLKVSTLSDCQRYSPGPFGSFATVAGLSSPRAAAGVIALPGGGALIAGGFGLTLDATGVNLTTHATADRYTAPAALAPTGSMQDARAFPLLTDLNDGTILVAGGGPTTAEIYQP